MAGNNWIDWVGILASFLTLCFVAWSAYSQWRTGRNSVQPVFAVWASYPGYKDDLCTVEISNKGFGPATVEEFSVFYKGEPGKGFSHEKVRDVLQEAFAGKACILKVAAIDLGYAVGAGETVVLASFYPPEEDKYSVGVRERGAISNEALAGYMSDFSLVVRYTDVYDRKWVFVTCQFRAYTFRDKPRSRFYRNLSSDVARLLH